MDGCAPPPYLWDLPSHSHQFFLLLTHTHCDLTPPCPHPLDVRCGEGIGRTLHCCTFTLTRTHTSSDVYSERWRHLLPPHHRTTSMVSLFPWHRPLLPPCLFIIWDIYSLCFGWYYLWTNIGRGWAARCVKKAFTAPEHLLP